MLYWVFITYCCSTPISVRDVLSWIKFINQSVVKLGPESSFYHGACLVFLDGIGCGSGEVERISRSAAELFINSLLNKHGKKLRKLAVTAESGFYGISPFFIEIGNTNTICMDSGNFKCVQFSVLSVSVVHQALLLISLKHLPYLLE